MFENPPKMSHLNFGIFTNFCPLKIDLSGNTYWPQASGFQKLAKSTIFGIFNELLSTQYVNVARFARNVEWDFFYDFQTLCLLNPLKCETKQLKKYLLEKRNVLTEKTQDAKIHFLRIQFTIRKLVQKSFELVLQ